MPANSGWVMAVGTVLWQKIVWDQTVSEIWDDCLSMWLLWATFYKQTNHKKCMIYYITYIRLRNRILKKDNCNLATTSKHTLTALLYAVVEQLWSGDWDWETCDWKNTSAILSPVGCEEWVRRHTYHPPSGGLLTPLWQQLVVVVLGSFQV